MEQFPKADALRLLRSAFAKGGPAPPTTTAPPPPISVGRRKFKGRRRLSVGRSYTVNNAYAYLRHKRNSWTRHWIECLCGNTDTRAAINAIDVELYPNKTLTSVDFDWAVKQGYITFN